MPGPRNWTAPLLTMQAQQDGINTYAFDLYSGQQAILLNGRAELA